VLGRFLLLCFGLVTPLLLAEGGLRLAGGVVLAVRESNNLFSLTRNGIRVLCLGESTTQGQYPRFLEDELNRGSPNVRFSVIDKGLAGTDTGVILATLDDTLDATRPDIVVAMIGVNDEQWATLVEIPAWRRRLRELRVVKLGRLAWAFSRRSPSVPAVNEADLYRFEREFEPRNPAQAAAAALYRKQADFHQGRGEWAEAEAASRRLLKMNPWAGDAYVYLARVYRARGEWDRAEAIYRTALSLGPRGEWAHRHLGEIYFELGRWDRAVACFQDALQISPQDPRLHFRLGHAFHNLKQWAPAEAAFLKAVSLDEGFLEARKWLGTLYELTDRPDRAMEQYRFVAGRRPRNEAEVLEIYACRRKLAALTDPPSVPSTASHYRGIVEAVRRRGIRFVAVQYPLRDVAALKEWTGFREDVAYVDNGPSFQQAVKNEGYDALFVDRFAGDFGHCTEKGNRLLARNIAAAVRTVSSR
jgi:tetratricopeptide (TPR) repeat protein